MVYFCSNVMSQLLNVNKWQWKIIARYDLLAVAV